jgi:hypothetical protein
MLAGLSVFHSLSCEEELQHGTMTTMAYTWLEVSGLLSVQVLHGRKQAA